MKRSLSAALALSVTLVARSGAAQPAASASGVAAIVDAAANRIVDSKRVPGLAIAVEERGTVTFARGYGYADTAKKTPVTADTRFEIGSVTKQFTAACVLQLVEAKKVSLDDRLGTYVSDYFIGRGVTVRQLLEQTSGIPEFLNGPDAVDAAGTQPATYATILARVSAKPLEFVPGTKWKYSNTNYILLGRIVEVASHEPYEAYVRAHIFAPAKMTESGFIADEATLPAMARGYRATETGVAPAPPLLDEWAFSAGGIVSTVGDVLKWDDALLAGTIVSPAGVAEMRASAKLIDGSPTQYGFGWIVDAVGGHARIWHNGGTFGFHAANATFPSDRENVVVLANSSAPISEGLVTTAFAALHPDVGTALTTAAPGEDAKVTARVREWLHRFETDDIDRSQLTDAMSKALTPELLVQVETQFAGLGVPESLTFRAASASGPFTAYTYVASFSGSAFEIVMSVDATGKIGGYVVRRA